ncbi:MAG: ABC transporter permease, partial [Blautia sp.]|nr:ABC transporter permease [Blautia sp.]
MTKRKMFLRMITASLLRRRSRMLIALLSIAVGATILSGLVTIYIDVPRQMGAQFRSYGANMILLPGQEGALTGDTLQEALGVIPSENIVGATPYRYVRLDMPSRQQSFTTAGTDFAQVQKTSPYFSVEGEYPQNRREIMVGKEVAKTLGVKLGSSIELSYKPSTSAEEDPSKDWVAGAFLIGSSEGFNEAVLSVSVALDEEAKISKIEVDASSQTENIGSLVGTDQAFLQ